MGQCAGLLCITTAKHLKQSIYEEKRFYWLIVLEISAMRVGPEVGKRITTEALYSKNNHFMNPTVLFEGFSLPPEDLPLEGPPLNGSMAS